ncbi:hypothetical protein LINPERHAP2_LOCUS5291 [Linum perenne]
MFSTFKKCMNENKLTTIFTDQYAVIKVGITSVLPDTSLHLSYTTECTPNVMFLLVF